MSEGGFKNLFSKNEPKGWLPSLSNMNRATGTVLISMIILFIIVAVVLFSVYRYRQGELESVTVIDTPLKLYGMTEAKKFKGTNITSPAVGQEFTYSVWLYIVDYEDSSHDYRMLFMRTDVRDELNNANPIFFMDGRTNRLFITARTNVSGEVSDLADLVPDGSGGKNSKRFLTATVEYVPLQRWVNVAVVFQDNLMTVYLDGEMYSVRNVHDIWDKHQTVNRPIMSGTNGDIYVGPTDQNNDSVRGFISGLRFFNYALMADAIQAMYMQGPTFKSWGDKLGFKRYGIQSPIYRLDRDDTKDEDDA